MIDKPVLNKLNEIDAQFQSLSDRLTDPEVIASPAELQRVAKERSRLENTALTFQQYTRALQALDETEMLAQNEQDPELRQLAEDESQTIRSTIEALETKLNDLMTPKDPDADKNVIVEIRAGTGGDEASLFAADLCRMYSRFAESQGWKVEPISHSPSGMGGVKEAVFVVEGDGAFSRLKHESGVHRVQRVPVTEASGRIHTSAATVAVLPEAEEIDIQVDPADLEIDTMRSSGAGGQNVQKNETAVRITHKPSGLVVTCQDERSLRQNKEKAMRVLRSRLLDRERTRQETERRDARRELVRSGDRSEKIRTYNFPQNRVTDHRVGFTLHQLDAILDGDLGQLLDALRPLNG